MGLRINTNIASLNAQRSLAQVNERLGVTFRRLSTGLRITIASDDAAGLAISERLRAQIRSLGQAGRNAQDGISLAQVGEGALNEVSSILIRLRELATQANNGTVSSVDRATLNEEFQSLVDEIDRIARGTTFNGIRLLDGSSSTVSFQVGSGTTAGLDTLVLNLGSALSTTLSIAALDIGSGGSPSTAMNTIDGAIDAISRLRGRFGAMTNRLDSTIRNLGVQVENLSAAESRIRDVDVAVETARLTKDLILRDLSIAMLAQANALPQAALRLLQF